jgi:hypothetical protein
MMMLNTHFQETLRNKIHFFTFLFIKVLLTPRIIAHTCLYKVSEFAQNTQIQDSFNVWLVNPILTARRFAIILRKARVTRITHNS